jgi:hypothetical protein
VSESVIVPLAVLNSGSISSLLSGCNRELESMGDLGELLLVTLKGLERRISKSVNIALLLSMIALAKKDAFCSIYR